MASLQRAKVYAPHVTGDQRKQLRIELTAALRDIGSRYSEPVLASQHERHIVELAQRISQRCAGAIANRRLRLGIAQKALNLYLKYLWCLGRIPTPPHCPFDRRVIVHAAPSTQVSWTQIDDLSAYRAIVKSAVASAGGQSLAEWELRVYQGG